ncbi:DUF1361 domain-containing protein [Runella sp.]|jgi:uncharacterized membrane protein|uniref:DUF1361 domain-containing protein n=1 Tax=Runella sp. TaxID=1960881 RepID=UPI00261EA925|nr:DUF1361 domain-containing protein [Runella sp.]
MKNQLQLLGLLSSVSIVMIIGRVVAVENLGGVFLIWNLFLAWIPLGLAYLVEDMWCQRFIRRWGVMAGVSIWLLFFPNAPYLITDLMHLKAAPDHLIWYDALMNFSFALVGLLTGLYSLLKVHRLVEQIWNGSLAWIVVIGSLVLSSYGVYLGRFGRWNSWDIVTNPFSLVRYSVSNLHDPLAIKLTIVFSFAMLVIYGAFWLFTSKSLR